MNEIIIKGLEIYAYHGVHEEEKINGQKFIIDINVKADIDKACFSDDVNDTVSYSEIIRRVKEDFCSEKYDLIEKAAQKVIEGIFDGFPKVSECEILLKKPDAPINACFDYVAVRLRRKRDE